MSSDPQTSSGLPENQSLKVHLSGESVGLPNMMAAFTVDRLNRTIGMVIQNKPRFGNMDTMLEKVKANLLAVPIAVAVHGHAAAQNATVRGQSAWAAMIDDLELWHVVRFVHLGIPIPWMNEEQAQEYTNRVSGGVRASHSSRADGEEEAGPDDIVVQQGQKKTVIRAPPGGKCQQRQVGPYLQVIEVVWPSEPSKASKVVACIPDLTSCPPDHRSALVQQCNTLMGNFS